MDTLKQTLTFSMTQVNDDETKKTSVVCSLSITTLEASGHVAHVVREGEAALANARHILGSIAGAVIGTETVCNNCGAKGEHICPAGNQPRILAPN